ncbi:ABC transporter substrate-binding protein [Saccharothrix deserti]|uniref:ABC transporter substrate-binding protein n=1 Tax=Saccharothrix deserti TaxID=2593674 RepID=UPI00131C3C3F|nr:ABC transporter substrate-binding protein [Saccharothrix deserti]
MTRTTALLLTALLAAAGLSGCAGAGSLPTVTVLGSWTGEEEKSFEAVLAEFEAEENIDVEYSGTRALSQVLRSEVQQGTPPDLAVLPSPGELANYARDDYLQALDDVLGPQTDEYSGQWVDLERAATDRRYGVAVKADLKGTVWFNPKRLPGPKPATEEELSAFLRDIAGRGATPWCMGMGSTPDSGWPGTDWVENILLQQAGPDVYGQWAGGRLEWTSEPVKRAWLTWGQLAGPTAVRGGPKSVLLTDFGDAGRGLFDQPVGCLLDHQGTFAMSTYKGYDMPLVAGEDFDFFPFPSSTVGDRAWEVSADLAAMFNRTPESEKLIRFLASARGQEIWPGKGGAFSVNRKVPTAVYADDVSRKIATTLTSSGTFCFDASDLMPGVMRTAFYRAALEYVNDPTRLDTALAQLETVRKNIEGDEWLNFPCGGRATG